MSVVGRCEAKPIFAELRRHCHGLFLALLTVVIGVTVVVGPPIGTDCAQSKTADHLGAISGRVLYPDGRPVSGARVYPHILNQPFMGVPPRAFTNDKGEFLVRDLRPGMYQVPAAKEDEDYPDMLAVFYGADDLMPRVQVHSGEVTRGVLIRLGSKASRLVGRVEDADTHNQVRATITFYRAESSSEARNSDGTVYFSAGSGYESGSPESGRISSLGRGEFNILVPWTRPFGMKVSAQDYETWYYPSGTEERAMPLRMKPGEAKELIIPLRPLPPKSRP
jgi:hypothetical protein